jgi:hypothetical protein
MDTGATLGTLDNSPSSSVAQGMESLFNPATDFSETGNFPAPTFIYFLNDSALQTTDNFILVDESGEGKLYSNGKIRLVELSGSWTEMGRQYGYLLSSEIKSLSSTVASLYVTNNVGSTSDFYSFAMASMQLYPENYQQMLAGVLQTSGASYLDLAVDSNFFEYYVYAAGKPTNSCLSISAWGNYTGGNPLVVGRNFDFSPFYQALDPYLVVTVFNPDDGSVPTATISYTGQLGAISGLNKAGLTLENNDGGLSGDTGRYFLEREPILATSVSLLLNNETLGAINADMLAVKTPYPLIYNIAGPQRAYTYETSTSQVIRRDSDPGGSEGLLVAANTYLDPSWPANTTIPPAYTANSTDRYNSAVSLANSFYGAINDRTMMAILDTPIEQGGPTPYGDNDSIWQYAAIPQAHDIWIKASNYMNWSFVDLDKYFH